MKNTFLLCLFLIGWLLSACDVDDGGFGFGPDEQAETAYLPVLMERSQLEQSITTEAPRDIIDAAKIYIQGRYIYITERYKGLHIVDNTDPRNPRNLAFVKVPGCIDVAAKGSNLYVDNATDLVTLDASDLTQIVEVARTRNIFPDALPPDLNFIPAKYQEGNRPDNTIIIQWTLPE